VSDIKLNAAGNDIDLSGSELTLVDGTDAIAQHLLIRLRFFKGEFFLDRLLGVPYYESILLKNPNLNVVRNLFRETIIETPGVLAIQRFDLSLDGAVRNLSVDFSCQVTGSDAPLDFSQSFTIG